MKNDIKKVVTIGLTGFLLGTTLTVSAGTWIQAYRNNEIKISLNGEIQTFRDATTNEIEVPIMYNDRTYLPLRSLATLVGLNVDYDDTTQTAILETKDYQAKKAKKIDEARDIIYKLHTEDVNITDSEFYGDGNVTHKCEYPFINIDSKDAKSINNDIAKQIEKAKKIDTEKEFYELDYTSYYSSVNDNVLTLVLGFMYTMDDYHAHDEICNFHISEVYFIDIYTGKLLSTEEVLKTVNNITKNDIDLKKVYDVTYIRRNVSPELMDEFINNPELLKDDVNYNEYSDYYTNKTIDDMIWYIDDNKNIIVEMYWYSFSGPVDGVHVKDRVNVTEIIGRANNYYLIENSDKEIIQENSLLKGHYPELDQFSNSELNLAYNEIFARHGHDFQSQNLKEHFNKMLWYKPVKGKQVTLEELNDVEKENAKIIKQEIEKRKAILNELK